MPGALALPIVAGPVEPVHRQQVPVAHRDLTVLQEPADPGREPRHERRVRVRAPVAPGSIIPVGVDRGVRYARAVCAIQKQGSPASVPACTARPMAEDTDRSGVPPSLRDGSGAGVPRIDCRRVGRWSAGTLWCRVVP